MRRRAFTLIELLTVIAILAVLAAILFPVFASAKKSAKKTVSLSNVGQLNKAIMLYGIDYDDRPPPFCGDCHHSGEYFILGDGPNTWMVLSMPYLGMKGTPTGYQGICLAEDLPSVFFDENEVRKPQKGSSCEGWGIITSWGINDVVVDKLGTVLEPGKNRVRSLTSFSQPSGSILLVQTKSYLCADENMPGYALAVPPRETVLGWDAESTIDGIYGSEKNPMNLVSFLDGSSKLVPRWKIVNEPGMWGLD